MFAYIGKYPRGEVPEGGEGGMASNGASATNDPLDLIVDRFDGGCLRASVADSRDRGWREQLLAGFRVKLEGTAVSAISIMYGQETGWFSIIREDGLYKADFWAPELRRASNQARSAIDTIAKELSAVLALEHIRIRGKLPFGWLAEKGWSQKEIARLRRAA